MSRIIVLTARFLLALIVVATAYAGSGEPSVYPDHQAAEQPVSEALSS